MIRQAIPKIKGVEDQGHERLSPNEFGGKGDSPQNILSYCTQLSPVKRRHMDRLTDTQIDAQIN